MSRNHCVAVAACCVMSFQRLHFPSPQSLQLIHAIAPARCVRSATPAHVAVLCEATHNTTVPGHLADSHEASAGEECTLDTVAVLHVHSCEYLNMASRSVTR